MNSYISTLGIFNLYPHEPPPIRILKSNKRNQLEAAKVQAQQSQLILNSIEAGIRRPKNGRYPRKIMTQFPIQQNRNVNQPTGPQVSPSNVSKTISASASSELLSTKRAKQEAVENLDMVTSTLEIVGEEYSVSSFADEESDEIEIISEYPPKKMKMDTEDPLIIDEESYDPLGENAESDYSLTINEDGDETLVIDEKPDEKLVQNAESDFKFIIKEESSYLKISNVVTLSSPSKRKPSSPAHIKRPLNAFMAYSKTHRRIIMNRYPQMHHAAVSKELGATWKALTVEEKKPFYVEAKRLADEHVAKYPDYKYKPKQKKVKSEDCVSPHSSRDVSAFDPLIKYFDVSLPFGEQSIYRKMSHDEETDINEEIIIEPAGKLNPSSFHSWSLIYESSDEEEGDEEEDTD